MYKAWQASRASAPLLNGQSLAASPSSDLARQMNKYRLGVGIVLFNKDGKVWAGKRARANSHCWQLPQGGIEADEVPLVAARRELLEETGCKNMELLAETPDWLSYTFPTFIEKKMGHCGQKQKWFAFRFLGDEAEFCLEHDGVAEFCQWQWMNYATLSEQIIDFKHALYQEIGKAFAQYIN